MDESKLSNFVLDFFFVKKLMGIKDKNDSPIPWIVDSILNAFERS